MNTLEIFNESIILISLYHLIIFSDINPVYELKYKAGWSLNLLIVVQFFVNIAVIGYSTAINAKIGYKQMQLKI